MAVGAIEPQFYALLLDTMGLKEDPTFQIQMDRSAWPELKVRLAAIFRGKTRDEWCAIMEGTDTCFAPVLSLTEAPHHPHNIARGTFITVDGQIQPAPAPRFSRTPAAPPQAPREPGAETNATLAALGYDAERVTAWRASGAIA